MITNNLKNLLEKSNTSIKELSETTGINRNSLTNLANGTSQMVRFDTLNKLIKYFSLQEISDLLEFAPDESSNIKNLQIHFKDRKITFEYEFIHDDNIDNFDVEIPFQFIENEKIVIFNFNSGSDTDITSFIKKCELAIFGENNFTVKKDYSSHTIDLGQQIKKMEKDGINDKELYFNNLSSVLDELKKLDVKPLLENFEKSFLFLFIFAISTNKIKDPNDFKFSNNITTSNLYVFQWPKEDGKNGIAFSNTRTLEDLA